MTIIVRQLTSVDGDAFSASVDRAIAANELLGSSSPHGEWLTTWSLAEPHLVGIAELDGTFAGWVHPEVKALVVEPAFRRQGIGWALVELGLDMERLRARPNLLLGAVPGAEPAHAFLVATGFEQHSLLWDLDLAPGRPVAAPVFPDGIVARPVVAATDWRPWSELFNAAFADHPTPLQIDLDRAGTVPADLPWREEDVVLLESSGELIAFCATQPTRRPDGSVEPEGEIWTIGVRPDRQGKGLGRQLLRWGVQHLRGLGVETVTLSVNGRNAGALALYESEGFVRTSTRERWARPVAGG